MGRCSWGWKTTADGLLTIEIDWLLKQRKYVEGDCSYNRNITWTFHDGDKSTIGYDVDFRPTIPFVKLHYTVNASDPDRRRDIDYSISLTLTSCHIGGYRYWFVCPGNRCGSRRVGKLYLQGGYFLCRHCHNLTYDSRNTNKRWRMLTKIFDYEKRQVEMCKKMRTTQYRGKPTKRYLKYLNLDMRLSLEEQTAILNGKIFL